MTDEV